MDTGANPLTIVVDASGCPDSVLTAEQFELFREVTWRAFEKVPPNQWPKFETGYSRRGGGVFIFVAADPAAKA